MPPSDKPAQPSPFEIVTSGKSKKIGKPGIIIGVSIVIFLILSVVAGVLLVRQQQTIQEKASSSCIESCPVAGRPDMLADCHPPDSDGTSDDKICNSAGRIDTCGAAQTKYCCPSAGASWTTNMSACATPTPTATATPTPTPTPTATGNTPTPTGTSTGAGNSCNGTCGSNSNCQSGLYCYSGYCRNYLCASDATCGCGSATPTSTATATTKGSTTAQTTPLPVPVTGTNWTTYAGVGIGVVAILISVLLAL